MYAYTPPVRDNVAMLWLNFKALLRNICISHFLLVVILHSDIDECEEGTSGCSQNCNNNIGSYYCTCMNGFDLESDAHSCTGNEDTYMYLTYISYVHKIQSMQVHMQVMYVYICMHTYIFIYVCIRICT